MEDIAKACGVSKMTVSRVLRGKPNAAGPKSRERILSAARRMNYRVNTLARQLKRNRAEYLGIATSFKGLLGSFYFQEIVKGIQSEINGSEYGLALVDTETREQADARKLFDLCRLRRVDGLVVVSPRLGDKFLDDLSRGHFPVAAVGGSTERHSVYSCSVDDDDAMRQGIEHLHGLGHRKIGFLAGPSNLLSAQARRAAFLRHADRLGIVPANGWIEDAEYTRQGGSAAALAILGRSRRPTALLAANDLSALGAYEACHRLGLRVPDDLSIVGMDDIPESEVAAPGLTTVRQPVMEFGRRAAAFVLRSIEGLPPSSAPELLCGSLIVRESTRSPRK